MSSKGLELRLANIMNVVVGIFSVPIGVPGATSGSMFTPIPVDIDATEAEVTGMDLLQKTKLNKMRMVEPIPDLARISEGTTKLEMMLDAVIKYVESVLEGKEVPNNSVGRKLLDLVNSVPKMTPEEFEKMINSNMKVKSSEVIQGQPLQALN